MKQIISTHRLTSSFLSAMPPTVASFTAYLYVTVPRKKEAMIPEIKYGMDVRIDPCYLDWDTKTITICVPANINPGITSINDLEPTFYESIEAAFLALIYSLSP